MNSNLDETFIYYLFTDVVSSPHYTQSGGKLSQQLKSKVTSPAFASKNRRKVQKT